MFQGTHFQNAYVTRNLDLAVEHVTATADVREVVRFEGSSEVLTSAGPGVMTSTFALIWIGDFQLEFIQPVSEKVPVYSSLLPEDDSLRFHHSCMRVRDWGHFRAGLHRLPFSIALESTGEQVSYVYLDAREMLGHYLEYVWIADERWTRLGGRTV